MKDALLLPGSECIGLMSGESATYQPPQQEARAGIQKPTEYINLTVSIIGSAAIGAFSAGSFSWHKAVKLVGKELDTLEPEFEVHHRTGNQLAVRQ